MEVKLDESDLKTLKIMQNSVEDLYQKLGILERQHQKRKEDVIKGIDEALERRYSFMQTMAEKYELESGSRWEFNMSKGCFEVIPEYKNMDEKGE